MALCSTCRSINLDLVKGHLTDYNLLDRRSDSPGEHKGLVLWAYGSDLEASQAQCALCALIVDALIQDSGFRCHTPVASHCNILTRQQHFLADEPVILEPKADPHKTTFPEPPAKGSHISSLHVIARERGTEKLLRGKIRLFLRNSTLKYHRCDIIGRPKLSGLACDDTVSLLRKWLDACKSHHVSCREALSGETLDGEAPRQLPSRLLHIDKDNIRLVRSSGLRGRYVALSHCWGPSDERPVSTTLSNIEAYEEDIPWSSLPKTYHDAIIVTRCLSIPYLWIDSLCIIQDDRQDWRRESRQMGFVYEGAELTIAASHASNSSEGFLHKRESLSAVVEMPNFLHSRSNTNSQHTPIVYAWVRQDTVEDSFPEHGPLNQRAWATQEWLLSRRVIFFTPAVVMWSCKSITQRETGERCFNISRNLRWKSVVEAFSERKLTYPTDRLIALEGLHTELQKKSGNTYMSGIWLESLPDQLLWQVTEQVKPSFVDPLVLPTWTWAHVPRGVRFLQIHGAKSLCHSIKPSNNKQSLTVRAPIQAIASTTQTLDNTKDDATTAAITLDINASHAKQTGTLAAYILHDTNPIGWIVYDQETQPYQANGDMCLALMSNISRRDDAIERRSGNIRSNKLRHHWNLVLRRRGDTGEWYRVGVGKTYSRQWWANASIADVLIT